MRWKLLILHTDTAINLLLPELHNVQQPTFWYADDSAQAIVATLSPQPLLTLITNRYDIYQQASNKKINAIFSDFNPNDYPKIIPEKIVYRVSKEKALVHHLFNQAAKLLSPTGELLISGYKHDGIKTYADKLNKQLKATGTLKKQGAIYSGRFSQLSSQNCLDDQHYPVLQQLLGHTQNNKAFYSKPGVFGWNKIDTGTDLLLNALAKIYPDLTPKPKNALDLGCGYGWIFLNLDDYGLASITATDNNAAALLSAERNTSLIKTPATVIAGDCGNTITEAFDLILCNPPFHQGFAHAQALTEKFIRGCHQRLKPSGHLFIVSNEFIGIEKIAAPLFKQQTLLMQAQGFKVLLLRK
jgi:16S rRNA (guanine1207-N2)-methyltransferase